MINKRKILALIILLAGVVISASIINSDNAKKNKTTVLSGSGDNPSFDFSNLKNEGSKLNLPGESAEFASEETEGVNLTETLADTYTKDLLKNSADGRFPSEEEALQILEENTSQGFTYPKFEEKDIKISSDNSEEKQIAYIELVDKAMWNRFGELKDENTATALRKFFENNDDSVISGFIEATPKYLDDLLQVEVPEIMKESHLDMLNVWRKKLAMYEAVVSYDSDPFKGYLAVKDLPEVIQKSQDIQSVLIQRYNELTKG